MYLILLLRSILYNEKPSPFSDGLQFSGQPSSWKTYCLSSLFFSSVSTCTTLKSWITICT